MHFQCVKKGNNSIKNICVDMICASPYDNHKCWNRISGVMVSILALCAVDRGFEAWLNQTNDYKIGICCFHAKHATLRSKKTDCLAPNQNN